MSAGSCTASAAAEDSGRPRAGTAVAGGRDTRTRTAGQVEWPRGMRQHGAGRPSCPPYARPAHWPCHSAIRVPCALTTHRPLQVPALCLPASSPGQSWVLTVARAQGGLCLHCPGSMRTRPGRAGWAGGRRSTLRGPELWEKVLAPTPTAHPAGRGPGHRVLGSVCSFSRCSGLKRVLGGVRHFQASVGLKQG